MAGPKSGKKQPGRPSGQIKKERQRFTRAVIILGILGVGALAYLGTRPAPSPIVRDSNVPPPPAESAKGYTMGNPNAPVHIIEFADFECPACANYAVVTEPDVRSQIIDKGLATLTYFDFPLPMHKNTWWASYAAACANDQGKFWEMHDRIFAGQADWNGEVTSNPLPILTGYAKDLGLDVSKWTDCVKGAAHQRDIEARRAEAERMHVQQTPTFFVGNRELAGAVGYDALRAAVDSATHTAQPPAKPAS